MAVRELGNAGGNPLGLQRKAPAAPGPQEFNFELKTRVKKGDAVFANSDGSNQFAARRAISPMALVSSAAYGNGMSTGGYNPDDDVKNKLSLCSLQNGYTILGYIEAPSSSAASGFPFVRIYDENGKLKNTINVTASTVACSHIVVCISGENTFNIFYYDGAAGSQQAFYYKRYDFNGNLIGSQVTIFSEPFSNCGGLSADWDSSLSRLCVCVSVTNKSEVRWFIFNDNGTQLYSGTRGTVSSSLKVAAIPSSSKFVLVYSTSSSNFQAVFINSSGVATLVSTISNILLDPGRSIDLAGLSNGGFAVFGAHSTGAKSLLLYNSSGALYSERVITGEKQSTEAIESNDWGFIISYSVNKTNSQPLVTQTFLNNGSPVSSAYSIISDTHTNGVPTMGSCSYSNGEILFWYANDTDNATQYAYFAPTPSNDIYSLAGFALSDGISGDKIKLINPIV